MRRVEVAMSDLPIPTIDPDKLLPELQHCLISGDFETGLSTILRQVQPERLRHCDELTRLRVLALAAELLDYSGRYEDARTLIEEEGRRCQKILGSLDRRRTKSSAGVDLSLTKQQVWVVIHYGYTLYRRSKFTDALAHFELCRRVVNNVIGASLRCDGTLARVHYCIGLAQREEYQYTLAKENFTRSMDYAWHNLGTRIRTAKSNLVESSNSVFATFSNAKTLGLGLGWIHYSEGQLELAMPLLLAAKNLLVPYHERLIKAYVDVVYASILRAEKGDKPDSLNEAIAILDQSHEVFRKHSHDYYRVRSANQLAIAHLEEARNYTNISPVHRKALKTSLKFIREMKDFATSVEDRRFLCNALVIESRVKGLQQKHSESLALAELAVAQASGNLFGQIDAHIALGEALLKLEKYEAACHEFEWAATEGKRNPKVRAVCELHLANANALNSDLRSAIRHYHEWQLMEPQVRNAFMRNLADAVNRLLEKKTEDFVVPWSRVSLSSSSLQQDLREWLVKWARSRTGNEEEAAHLLGVSKQTYYTWKSRRDRSAS